MADYIFLGIAIFVAISGIFIGVLIREKSKNKVVSVALSFILLFSCVSIMVVMMITDSKVKDSVTASNGQISTINKEEFEDVQDMYLSTNGEIQKLYFEKSGIRENGIPYDVIRLVVPESFYDMKMKDIKLTKNGDAVDVVFVTMDSTYKCRTTCSESDFCNLMSALSGKKVNPGEYEIIPSPDGYIVILDDCNGKSRSVGDVQAEIQRYIASGEQIPENLLAEYKHLSGSIDARTFSDVQSEMSEYLSHGETIPDTLFEEYNQFLNQSGIDINIVQK